MSGEVTLIVVCRDQTHGSIAADSYLVATDNSSGG